MEPPRLSPAAMRTNYLLPLITALVVPAFCFGASTKRTLDNVGENPKIRVLVMETSGTVTIEGSAPFRCALVKADGSPSTSRELPRLVVQPPLGTGSKVTIAPPVDGVTTISAEGERPRSTHAPIEISETSGSLRVIAELHMEEYLRGVVPYEIGSDAPLQAKCAQAVAARSFALLALVRSQHPNENFEICAEICCQVYGGLEKAAPDVDQAVASTRGQVLTFEGEPIPAYYAGNCGGWTEDIRVAWPGRSNQRAYFGAARFDGPNPPALDLTKETDLRDWLTSSPASYCNMEHFKVPAWASRNLRWKREFTAEEVTAFVAQRQDIGRVRAIRPGGRGPSGRLKSAGFVGENGTYTASPEYDIRKVFEPYLRSGSFVVETKGSAERPTHFILTGGGAGHGVGMCQTGAMGMANDGKNFAEILKHYYPNAELRKVY